MDQIVQAAIEQADRVGAETDAYLAKRAQQRDRPAAEQLVYKDFHNQPLEYHQPTSQPQRFMDDATQKLLMIGRPISLAPSSKITTTSSPKITICSSMI